MTPRAIPNEETWEFHDDEGREIANEPEAPAPTTMADLLSDEGKAQAWRFAPWNEEAEESLIGSMLLSADGRRAALDGCTAEDLWSPRLRHIYEAIERLHNRGGAVDPVTVADECIADGVRIVTSDQLRQLQGHTPASANATHYAKTIAEYALAREAMRFGRDLMDAGRAADFEALERLADQSRARLSPAHVDTVIARDLVELWELGEAERDDPSKPWAIPGCLRASEVAAFTGSEGLGKSTFLRQIGVCVAAGLHPFTGLGFHMERQSVLYLDLQEDEVDMADEMLKLRRSVEGKYEPGWYHAASMIEGIDLLSGRGQRIMEGLLARHRPALVLMGPVNSMFKTPEGRSRYGEDVIEELRAVMVGLMARYGFALILEGHAGNDRSHDEDWRIRGSSVWRSWPAFSLGLKEVAKDPREVDVIRARRDRYDGRVWPFKLFQKEGHKRPWVVSNADYSAILRHMGLHHLLGEAEAMTLDTGEEPF